MKAYANLIHFTDKELSDKIKYVTQFCIKKESTFDSKKDKCLDLLIEVKYKSSSTQLQLHNPYTLLFCVIKLLQKYSTGIPHQKSIISEKERRSRYSEAKDVYYYFLKVFLKNDSENIISYVMNTIDDQNIWKESMSCCDMVTGLIKGGYNGGLVFHEMCNKVELIARRVENKGIKFIVKIMYKMLGNFSWPESEGTKLFVQRILNLYYRSAHYIENPQNEIFSSVRGNLELCVRLLIQNISNSDILLIIRLMSSWSLQESVNNTTFLHYASTLEYAAHMHKGNCLVQTLTCEIFSILLQMIGSRVRLVSLLGNRVLQRLIDTCDNHNTFNTPQIFFIDMQLNLKLKDYQKEDKQFLKQYRETIHNSFIKSFMNHRHFRLNLESMYCTICLLIFEIPCGFTAAAISCLMMNLQQIIRAKSKEIGEIPFSHLNAIIISIITFICWMHDAKDCHKYVTSTVMQRAQWSPHLNPPLQSSYNYAIHHVFWDKPELFVDEWKIRYGLWIHFRLEPKTKKRKKYVENKSRIDKKAIKWIQLT